MITGIGFSELLVVAVLVLLLLPFIDKNPYRHWSKRWGVPAGGAKRLMWCPEPRWGPSSMPTSFRL